MEKKSPHVAPLDAVAKYANELTKPMLVCHTWRHAWDEVTTSVSSRDGRYYESIDCGRCSTLRVRIIDATTGACLGNRYQYPDGYRLRGVGRIDSTGQGLLRLESIHRMERD